MKLVQLSRTEHGHLRINPALALSVAANVHLVPLTLSEIRTVASQFPVFLAKDGETGQFYPCALMGLEPHENLYWTGSALDADHIPLNLLRLPFFIGGADPAQAAICLDEHSPGVDANGPCAILEPDGSDTGYITTIHGILDRLAAGGHRDTEARRQHRGRGRYLPLRQRRRRAGNPNLVSGAGKRLAEHRADRRVVVGNEDVSGRHVNLSPCPRAITKRENVCVCPGYSAPERPSVDAYFGIKTRNVVRRG